MALIPIPWPIDRAVLITNPTNNGVHQMRFMNFFDDELEACLFTLLHHGTMRKTANDRFMVFYND
jgi:hypothetical protein